MESNRELAEWQRRMILLVIRDGSNKDRWLSTREISDMSGISKTVVARRLKYLSQKGLIYHSVHRVRGRTGRLVKYFRWQLMPKVRENLEKGIL